MKYQLSTFEVLTGETCKDIILQMKGQLWEKELTLEGYMKKVSDRVEIQSSHTVRHDTPENFIEDMEAAGYLQKINE